jgi:hypothetical protein
VTESTHLRGMVSGGDPSTIRLWTDDGDGSHCFYAILLDLIDGVMIRVSVQVCAIACKCAKRDEEEIGRWCCC